MPDDTCGASAPRQRRIVDHRCEGPREPASRQMSGDFLAYSEDMCSWGGDEVHFLHQKLVPPVIPLGPRHASTFNRHPALRQIGDVIGLAGFTEVLPDAEVQDEVLD